MSISRDEVLYVAQLARLDLDEKTIDKLAGQIAAVLAYMDTLNQVPTEGVPPTSHAIPYTNAFREDEAGSHLEPDLVLANAPLAQDGCFVVPKVVG